MTLQCSWAS